MEKAPTNAEKRKIKMHLGIPLATPFPRCAAKRMGFFRDAIETSGNPDMCPECKEIFDKYMADNKDLPLDEKKKHMIMGVRGKVCNACQCNAVAGSGTDHYGCGWCHVHERTVKRTKLAKDYAVEHAEVLQRGKHPMQYTDPERWLDHVQEQGERATANVELRMEIDALRAMLQEIMHKCRIDEKPSEFAEILKELSGALGDQQFIDQDQGDVILGMMSKVLDAVTVPLTNARGEPMGDETRIKLINELAKTISKVSRDKLAVDITTMVDYNEFKIYMQDIFRVFLKNVPDEEARKKFLEDASKLKEPKPGAA